MALPIVPPERISVEDRGYLTACHVYIGNLMPNGYGRIQRQYVHRIAYEHAKGPIPPRLDIDHLCRVRNCINPDHLEAVTRRENLLRGETLTAWHAAKTHCIHGHEYTPENTGRTAGGRFCRACARAYDRRRRPPGSQGKRHV